MRLKITINYVSSGADWRGTSLKWHQRIIYPIAAAITLCGEICLIPTICFVSQKDICCSTLHANSSYSNQQLDVVLYIQLTDVHTRA